MIAIPREWVKWKKRKEKKRKEKTKERKKERKKERPKIQCNYTMKHYHAILNERGCSSDGRAFP